MADLTSPTELIISELVTNAINASAWQQHIRVCLLADGTLMVVEVWDEASGIPVLRETGSLDENGRGLALVNALASQWGWHPAHGRPGKCVWAALSAFLQPMQHSAISGGRGRRWRVSAERRSGAGIMPDSSGSDDD